MPPLVLAALLTAAPQDDAGLLVRQSREALRQGKIDEAVKFADRAVAADPKSAAALVARGSARFQAAAVADSIKDFEQAVELEPRVRPALWQLGIAYYYAGRYADGVRLFALHKSVNPDDVENAAWHFLCTAKAEGVEKAKANLMPIRVEADRRVPMAQVYALLQGKARPDDVLAAVAGAAGPEAARRRMYAHLYVGLYYEALGESANAMEHLEKAAAEPLAGDYMAGVARVHMRLLKKLK